MIESIVSIFEEKGYIQSYSIQERDGNKKKYKSCIKIWW